jgi:hypothetical protein
LFCWIRGNMLLGVQGGDIHSIIWHIMNCRYAPSIFGASSLCSPYKWCDILAPTLDDFSASFILSIEPFTAMSWHVSQVQFFFFFPFLCSTSSHLYVRLQYVGALNDLGTMLHMLQKLGVEFPQRDEQHAVPIFTPPQLQPIPNFYPSTAYTNQHSPGIVPPRAESNDNLPGMRFVTSISFEVHGQ